MISGSLFALLLELNDCLQLLQKYLIIPLRFPFLITSLEAQFIQLLVFFYSHL
jgi:hypothetical protein